MLLSRFCKTMYNVTIHNFFKCSTNGNKRSKEISNPLKDTPPRPQKIRLRMWMYVQPFWGVLNFSIFFFCRYIMQMVKVVLVTVLLTLCVIVDCLPHSSTKMRQKRGFRQSIVDRMGHGFGKRANTDLYDPYLTKTP